MTWLKLPSPRLAGNTWSGVKFMYVTTALLLLFGLIQIAWGERIPVNDGLGWDGAIYADNVRGFPQNVLVKQVRPDLLQRIFPEAVVNLGLRAAGSGRSNKSIIRGFEVYNLILLLISSIIWSLLTSEAGVSDRSKWLGFCLLFANFPILKQNFYYPVLTDTTAFTLSLFLAYCFLKRNALGVIVASTLGYFTWPTVFYSGILLYLLPNTNSGSRSPLSPARYRLNIMLAIAACGIVVEAILYLLKIPLPHSADQINEHLIVVSILIVVAYVLSALGRLLDFDSLFDRRAIAEALTARKLIFSALLFLTVNMTIDAFSGGTRLKYMTTLVYLIWGALLSVAKPGIFLISHIVYFGPVLLVFLYYFGSLSKIIHRHGIGLTLYFAFYILLALDSESRHIINVLPFVAALVTMFMDTLPWKNYHGWILCATCLLFSKIWLPINARGVVGNSLNQYYFMNHGPWMSNSSYVMQTIFVGLAGLFLYFVFFRRVSVSNEIVVASAASQRSGFEQYRG